MSRIIIGKTANGKPVSLDLDLLIRTRLLIQANSGGGKSYLIRRLVEQIFGKVQVFLIDPDGEFATLREKFGFLHVGLGGDTPADVRSARALAEKLLELRVSAVLDLYEAFRSRPGDRRAWVRNFLEGIMEAPKAYWRPLLVFVDEAHKFCPESVPKAASMIEREIISGCKEAMISLATAGRKRGFAAVWATQRLAKLDKDATAELLNRLVGMTIEDVDVDRAVELMSVSKDERADFKLSLKKLEPGHFYAFGRAISSERILVKVGPVDTTHPEPGSAKHADEPPPAPEEIKALLPKLSDFPREAEEKARTVAEFRAEIRRLSGELARAKKASPAPPAPVVMRGIAAPKEKTVEVPVPSLKEAHVRTLSKAAERVEKAVGSLSAAAGLLKEAGGAVRGELSRVIEYSKEARRALAAKVSSPPRRPETAVPARSAQRPARLPARDVPENGTVALVSGERKMLEVLARFGIRTKSQLGTLAGYTMSGGTYQAYFRKLKRTGYVIELSDGSVEITAEGRAVLGDRPPEAPRTTEEVLNAWRAMLVAGERKMLDELVTVYPDGLTPEELGERTGYAPEGGTFQAYSRTLKRNKIACFEDGRFKASSDLFELEVGA